MKNFFNFVVFLMTAVVVLQVATAQVRPMPPTNLTLGYRPPDGRAISWNSGVRGGIPNYPMAVNVKNAPFNAKGDGVTDDFSAITNAIAHCTNGGAVYFPPGHYKLGTLLRINWPKQIVLRGAGPTSTFLESYTTTSSSDHGAISFSSDTDRHTSAITSGYTARSQSVVVSSTSGMAPGQLARILQDNDPAVVFGSLSNTDVQWQGQLMMITNISGMTVTFNRPLYYTYGASFNPVLSAFTKATAFCGMEDLTLDMKNNSVAPSNPLYFYVTMNCWLMNVVVTNGYFSNIGINQSYAMTVRHCETYNHQVYDSNTRYGIQLAGWASDCLIEDNIVQGNNAAIVIQQGSCGNVVSYNFSNQGFGNGYPNDLGLKGGMGCHGDNANMNLFEGNVMPWLSFDEFWGENRGDTVFRNWVTRFAYVNQSNLPAKQGSTAVYMDAANHYHNVIGNILGNPGDFGDKNTSHVVWQIGFARGKGNNPPQAPADPKTAATLLVHGNFDFVSGTTEWSNNIAHNLPQSYYLSARPSWFGNLPWPPIGPDVNTTSTITNGPVIPAQARYMGVSY